MEKKKRIGPLLCSQRSARPGDAASFQVQQVTSRGPRESWTVVGGPGGGGEERGQKKTAISIGKAVGVSGRFLPWRGWLILIGGSLLKGHTISMGFGESETRSRRSSGSRDLACRWSFGPSAGRCGIAKDGKGVCSQRRQPSQPSQPRSGGAETFAGTAFSVDECNKAPKRRRPCLFDSLKCRLLSGIHKR